MYSRTIQIPTILNDSNSKENIFPENYFLPRDFELVQALYDLAFFLEISSSLNTKANSQYRILSLRKAAHNLDGYSTSTYRWLKDSLKNTCLDFQPSNRIKQHLLTVIEKGALEEISEFSLNNMEALLRLRSIRGMGPKQIAEFAAKKHNSPLKLIEKSSKRCGLKDETILAIYNGLSYGTWQAAHIIPPLLRFLNRIEQIKKKETSWIVCGITDGISSIEKRPEIINAVSDFKIDKRLINKIIATDPFFKLLKSKDSNFEIKHIMGWTFSISSKREIHNAEDKTIFELAEEFDPLVNYFPQKFKSDLHTHTSWSDGIASPIDMINSADKRGLSYIAITDHSRSCKLQRGLTPSAWLRQAMSLKRFRKEKQVMHGLEVDILGKEGRLDMPEGILEAMDWVIGSVHTSWSGNKTIDTDRMIQAVESGLIDVIGHPTSALSGRPGISNYVRPPVDLDWEKVFQCCAKWHVALEVNCFPSRLDLSHDLLKKAVDSGCWISIGSDAHATEHLDLTKFGLKIVEKANVSNVLNYLNYDELKKWRKEARKKRKLKKKTVQQSVQGDLFEPASTNTKKKELISIEGFISNRAKVPDGSKIMGIDLTAGKNKKSGVALLSGNNIKTCSLLSDDELLDFIDAEKPAIVSIDSPLGLPGGGKEIDKKFGIVRLAERELASVGIPSYPALINSMKFLTLRGIRLRELIKNANRKITVIESYPGAAQDILCIPRKQRGLGLLREGLRDLGLKGTGLETQSHDEMDAITAAIVGRFYEAGSYEAMGIPSEAQLIVPTLPILNFEKPPIICLSGRSVVGKSVVARYLSLYYGFKWIKTWELECKEIPFRDRFAEILSIAENINSLPESEISILFEMFDLEYPISFLFPNTKEPVVVDAITSKNDIAEIVHKERKVLIWHIDCPEVKLMENRKNNGFPKTNRDFSDSDTEANELAKICDNELLNNDTLEKLHWAVDDTLFSCIINVSK